MLERLLISAVACTALAGCSAVQEVVPTPPSSEPSTSEESTATSTAPSITRDVPPEQRRMLGTLTAADLCGLLRPDEIAALAFDVEPGRPREVGIEPPVRGCAFESRTGGRQVLIGAQAPGYADLGDEEIELGPVRGTKVLRTSDCTVYAPVAEATLQVSVISGETDSDLCRMASDVTQYVLPVLS
ncbi:DUF3558 family protein [Saccharopolyspora sp. TS4A08]|uniref:DUF3558 family protein n=1 Tax=Saccharopolyspora ipomoeae TaxID=3042027 RepID=A0ABT6PTL2_9PSEU|nr:DUF3558 family protein [Saccharopolyspora sp. TS4A08]MDI2031222.1 DUF3558 family protein [Saccharopolyspora sp. TS4A08]